MNLREQAEADLSETLEGDFGLPIVLIDPDGVTYDTIAGSDPPLPLVGRVVYRSRRDNLETGSELTYKQTIATVRKSSLSRVPQPDEKWTVKVPLTPDTTAPLVTHLLQQPTEESASLGIIRLYLMATEQIAP